jgi:hypothetical protein
MKLSLKAALIHTVFPRKTGASAYLSVSYTWIDSNFFSNRLVSIKNDTSVPLLSGTASVYTNDNYIAETDIKVRDTTIYF